MESTLCCPDLIATALQRCGVTTVFGVVGYPITEVAFALQRQGVQFYATRTENAAGYAASGFSYLSASQKRVPGVFLTTGGPGFVNALAGLTHAMANRFPVLLLSGSCSSKDLGKGGFQELNQFQCVTSFEPFCKRAYSCFDMKAIPSIITDALEDTMRGVPGAVYVDIPADLIMQGTLAAEEAETALQCCNTLTHRVIAQSISGITDDHQALQLKRTLECAQAPLIVVGKGAAMSLSSKVDFLEQFLRRYHLPVLPTSFGRGLIADDATESVTAARSRVLKEADVVLLLGARLNWLLHYGEPPRWRPDVKFIVVDVEPADKIKLSAATSKIHMYFAGDIQKTLGDIMRAWDSPLELSEAAKSWIDDVCTTAEKRREAVIRKAAAATEDARLSGGRFLRYRTALHLVASRLSSWKAQKSDRLVTVVSEGAKTMDLSRLMIPTFNKRGRLDAGTWGTMGLGLPYALAASVFNTCVDHLTVAVEGDSAIGFSLMELETLTRYNYAPLIIVLNNGGIYQGRTGSPPLPTQLAHTTRYETFAEAVGGIGRLVTDIQTLEAALDDFFYCTPRKLCVIHVQIFPEDEEATSAITHYSPMS